VTLESDDGALIHMTFSGVRDDANHYFRTLPLFETNAPKYAFLNRLLAVGIGEIRPDGPFTRSKRFSEIARSQLGWIFVELRLCVRFGLVTFAGSIEFIRRVRKRISLLFGVLLNVRFQIVVVFVHELPRSFSLMHADCPRRIGSSVTGLA
jgi:hypothetical protein